MRDVKAPHPGISAGPPIAASTLTTWLATVGLQDLLGAIIQADQREGWVINVESGPLEANMRALNAALLTPAAANGHNQSLPDDLAIDLMYLLAFLRMSQCLELLYRLNSRLPDITEQLVRRAMSPAGQSSREVALLSNRLLHLMRYHAAQQIFSPARRAEVMAAVIAARQ